jgi:hypothetical protein
LCAAASFLHSAHFDLSLHFPSQLAIADKLNARPKNKIDIFFIFVFLEYKIKGKTDKKK